jgi:hypothetical protein
MRRPRHGLSGGALDAVFRFDMAEGQIRPKRRGGTVLARSNATFRQKSELTHPKEKHLSFASRFGRQRPSREATTQNASVGTEVTSDGYSHLRFFIIIVLRIYNVFWYNNPMLQFNTAIQLQHVSSSAHTIQIGWGRVAPACREHFVVGIAEAITHK